MAQWVKNPPAMQETGDAGSIPGLGPSPSGVGNGNPLQYSCLGKLMDRGAQWATVHWIAERQTGLSDLSTSKTGMRHPLNIFLVESNTVTLIINERLTK